MFKEFFFLLELDFDILNVCFVCPSVLGVLGGIDNMLEGDFLYPGDFGEA
jgi:hypothetical protein